MNDQISRQKLIEKISKLPILITKDDDFVDLDAVLYAINSQPPADQWIPCKTCDKRYDKWENSET